MFACGDRSGAAVSRTVTVNVFGAETLFETSFAVQDTDVAPSGKVTPLAGLHVTVGAGSIRSFAAGENVTTAPLGPVASCVIAGGCESAGGLWSLTTMSNATAGEELLELSFAVHETLVVPIGYVYELGP
jgi:hypothetical protein